MCDNFDHWLELFPAYYYLLGLCPYTTAAYTPPMIGYILVVSVFLYGYI
jgi:hypothetical protein